LVLACLLPIAGSNATPFKSKHRIDFLQWNPSHQCLGKSPSCRAGAEKALTEMLQDEKMNLDFATVIGFGDQPYVPPKGWDSITSVGQSDSTTLIYNGSNWKSTPVKTGSNTTGCMVGEEGPYVVTSLYHRHVGYSAVVVAAHFPPPPHFDHGVKELAKAIKFVSTYSFQHKYLLMADTNTNETDAHCSSKELMTRLGGEPELTVSTDPVNTCCLNNGFTSTFDRIVATFPMKFTTQVLFQPTPRWAAGEFHRAIIGTLHMPMMRSQEVLSFV